MKIKFSIWGYHIFWMLICTLSYFLAPQYFVSVCLSMLIVNCVFTILAYFKFKHLVISGISCLIIIITGILCYMITPIYLVWFVIAFIIELINT